MSIADMQYLALVADRLRLGAESYGDKSYRAPPLELAVEIEQELLDAAAWASILRARLAGLPPDQRARFDERLADVVRGAFAVWKMVDDVGAALPATPEAPAPTEPPDSSTSWLRQVLGDAPTIHVTNWSSKKLRGPGRRYTIMAAPRLWERGDGAIPWLTPLARDVRLVKDGTISLEEYRRRYLETPFGRTLKPGKLCTDVPPNELNDGTVGDGDTLCCACSRAAAARGECHRVWAAELLRRAGWRVILDGQELAGVDEEWRPLFAEAA